MVVAVLAGFAVLSHNRYVVGCAIAACILAFEALSPSWCVPPVRWATWRGSEPNRSARPPQRM